jgi:hypothetical protein
MKNAVFCDLKTQFLPHRKHITSPPQSPAGSCYVRFEVFTAATVKSAVFWDVTPCDACKNRRFGGPYLLHNQSGKNRRIRNSVSMK